MKRETSYQVGDSVRIRPEWDGEREPVHVIVEWDGDRGLISPITWPTGTIRPQELVRAEMLEPAFPRPDIRKLRSDGARPTETEGDQDHARHE